MAHPKRALYAGSFDLLTIGHLWVIEEGAALFDELVVAVGVNPAKKSTAMFTVKERLEMLHASTTHLSNVKIAEFIGLYQFQYARQAAANFLLHGIRNQADYEFERMARYFNADFGDGLRTVIVMPPRELVELSSSFVKELIGYRNWEEIVRNHVPEPVFEKILAAHRG